MRSKVKRVLCYSPYNMWELHGLWETTILHALKIRGVDVKYVLCDGLYTECDIFWKATKPRPKLACTVCKASVSGLMSRMLMEYEWLSKYLILEEFEKARQWVNSLRPEMFFSAQYEDWQIGEWVRSSVHSHFRMVELDLENYEIQNTYREYLYSGIIACFGIYRILNYYNPDTLFIFNGRMSSTRIALELAKRLGVRVVVHERGFLKNSILLFENESCASLKPFKELWRVWKDIPLKYNELEVVSQYLNDREKGENLGWKAFSPKPQPVEDVCSQLKITMDKPIWVLFTSSEDEIIAEKRKSAFSSQMEWILKTIEYVSGKNVFLVIRVHPNLAGNKANGNSYQQLNMIYKIMNILPQNVRLVMPDDQISSYTLMEIATVGLTYCSTVSLEMACKGKTVVVAVESLVSDLPFVYTVDSSSSYINVLEQLMSLPIGKRSTEVMRMAFRFAYSVFFRYNIPFPLVRMLNPHVGVLTYRSLEDLKRINDKYLDRVVKIIMNEESVIPTPTENDLIRTEEDENKWFDERRK